MAYAIDELVDAIDNVYAENTTEEARDRQDWKAIKEGVTNALIEFLDNRDDALMTVKQKEAKYDEVLSKAVNPERSLHDTIVDGDKEATDAIMKSAREGKIVRIF